MQGPQGHAAPPPPLPPAPGLAGHGRKGHPEGGIPFEISVHDAEGIHLRDVEVEGLKAAARGVGVFDRAMYPDLLYGAEGPLLDGLIGAAVLPFEDADGLALGHLKDGAFGVHLGGRPAVEPVDGPAVGDALGGDDTTMGRRKALAEDAAVKVLHVLLLQPPGTGTPLLVAL